MKIKAKTPHVLPRSSTMIERLHRLYSHFQGDDRVLVVITADPDAIASALALKRLLWRKVNSVAVTRTNKIKRPNNLTLIKYLNLNMTPLEECRLGDYTCLVMVDSQPHHQKATAAMEFKLIIDHHPLGEYVAPFMDVRPDYGATSTIMTEYLRAAKIKPSNKLATALFYGIKTDTSNFVRQGQLEDMKAFRFLFPYINQNMVFKIENSEMTKSSLKYFQKALDLVKIKKETAFVFMDQVDNPDTLVIVADFFNRVSDINRSIAAGLYKDQLVVIFRSTGQRMNAGKLAAASLGAYGPAGGHRAMARAEVPLANLNNKLLEKKGALERFLLRQISKQSPKPKPKNGTPGRRKAAGRGDRLETGNPQIEAQADEASRMK